MTILCYHAVQRGWGSALSVSPEAFENHAAWLARARRVVGLDTALSEMSPSGRLPRRTVAVTFDDGFASVFDHAFPILSRYGMPATIFLVAGTLASGGRPIDWVDDPPSHALTTLSMDQILEMQEAGVRFGSHSFAHHDLTSLSEEECQRDLRDSRDLLEDLLGTPVRHLAYPRGLHDERVRRAAAKAGFTHGLALPESPQLIGPYSVPRVGVYPSDDGLALRVKTSRWYLPLRTSRVFPAVRRFARGNPPPPRLPG